jgi:hypothetical protein
VIDHRNDVRLGCSGYLTQFAKRGRAASLFVRRSFFCQPLENLSRNTLLLVVGQFSIDGFGVTSSASAIPPIPM